MNGFNIPRPPRPIPPYMRNLVQDVARHECGHYVIGRFLGFRLEGCHLKILDSRGAHQACCTILPQQPLTTLDEVIAFAKNRVKMLNAGSLAQATRNGVVNNDVALSVAKEGGANDRAKVRELEHLIRNIRFPQVQTEAETQAQLNEIDAELWSDAAHLVDNNSTAIEAMGRAFANKITHDQQAFSFTVEEIERIPEVRAVFGLPPLAPAA